MCICVYLKRDLKMARVFGWPFHRVQLINSNANVCTFVASNDGERERGNAPPNAKTKTKKKKTKKTLLLVVVVVVKGL